MKRILPTVKMEVAMWNDIQYFFFHFALILTKQLCFEDISEFLNVIYFLFSPDIS